MVQPGAFFCVTYGTPSCKLAHMPKPTRGDIAFGLGVARLRAYRALSLRELSDLTEQAGHRVAFRTILSVEEGRRTRLATARALAKALGGFTVEEIIRRGEK